MDKTAIKNFAVWARVKLMDDIKTRLGFLGITEEGIQNPLPASTSEVQYFDIGSDDPIAIKGVAIRQRKDIVDKIRAGKRESGLAKSFHNFVEASAYEWFNRLIAIRYMEINEYAPLDMRILSSVEKGKQDPDLVSTPFDGNLEYTEQEEQKISEWKAEHDNKKLFRFLLFKMCNQLHEILPGIFERKDDASELLFRQSFIDKDGVIYHLVNDIAEEDWKDQVQIIGWIYQYYNSELKAETNKLLKKNIKITKERIPSATQLFTPDWIVRYMAENSLGRLWIEHLRALDPSVDEKETAEKFGWKYYLPEAKQDPEVEAELKKIREENYASLRPEDLSCLDPCMGSGHIEIYFFDVLEQIYQSVGYSERDAAKSILENNIYGLDIDDRAYQLAYFSVMMKARQYSRRILTSGVKPHVYSIQESNGITKEQLEGLGSTLSVDEKAEALKQAEQLVDLFQDAKEYGSILNIPEMDWDLLRRFTEEDNSEGQITLNFSAPVAERLNQLINQGEAMAKKYWVTCTNPPYMASSGMSKHLFTYVKKNFDKGRNDLYTVFILKCMDFCVDHGKLGIITQLGWLSLTRTRFLREEFYASVYVINMVHLGTKVFEELSGEIVKTAAFVVQKDLLDKFIGSYCKVDKIEGIEEKRRALIEHKKNIYYASVKETKEIKDSPLSYWLPRTMLPLFKGETVEKKFICRAGMQTGNNEMFLRSWYEVLNDKLAHFSKRAKWYPYNKGGSQRKWYGNTDLVVDWENDGRDIKSYKKKRYELGEIEKKNSECWNSEFYFKEGATWSSIASSSPMFRYTSEESIFDIKGPTCFANSQSGHEDILLVLGYLNTPIINILLDVLSPTLDCNPGTVSKLPYIDPKDAKKRKQILNEVNSCIQISKEDWNAFETSCDFQFHPLIHWSQSLYDTTSIEATMHKFYGANPPKYHSPLELSYLLWQGECNNRFSKLKSSEEELNRIFIDIYGLQDELSSEEKEKDVTVRKADLGRDIRSLISYALGCMFGRYSLDKEGLIYAGGDWKSVKDSYKTFLPDTDNVIPVTDQRYLNDDVVERICAFLTDVYGADTLEENLDFIARALGTKGLSSREVIRNYMLNDFFKDHCSTYSVTGSGKRPIYWLFDSGKQNAFKALVYMHRWNEDMTGRVLMYAQEIQKKYETEVRAIDMMLDHMTDSRQAATEEKRREHLQKQLTELIDYEERLTHMANERISIDLDDGVKVNYEKVQTDRNGKKYQILAPIK
jgi:hypothetical protein